MNDRDDIELEAFFAAAKDNVPKVPDDLMARVLADAQALQPVLPDPAPAAPLSLWDAFMDLIGGWPALSGVAAAGVTGLWLGFALEQLAADFMGNGTSVALISDVDSLFGETIDG